MKIPVHSLSLAAVLVMSCSFTGCASVDSRQHGDDWFGRDKLEHFAASAVIGAAAGAKLENDGRGKCDAAAGAVGITLAVGAGKEIVDLYIRKRYWSWRDMFWDLVGGVAGSLAATGCH